MSTTEKDLKPPVESVPVEQHNLPPLFVAPRFYDLRDKDGNEFYYQPAQPQSKVWYVPKGSVPTEYDVAPKDGGFGSSVTFSLSYPSHFPPFPPLHLFTRTVTLLIPTVNMGNTPIQAVKTYAIFTTSSLIPLHVGQTQSCTVVELSGNAYA